MPSPALVFLCLVAFLSPSAWGWLGIKSRTKPVPAKTQPAAIPAPVNPISDTTSLSRTVQVIRAGSPGTYLGNLEGVRCFNCAPDLVLLNLDDSDSRESVLLALRIEVWNAIERPLKDRRMYDYENRCFYFGYNERDTVYVGGEWREIRAQELPCYPYLKRTLSLRQAEAD